VDRRCGKRARETLLRDHHGRGGILQDVSEPLLRIGRIHGNVGAPCLEHREQRHEHLRGALHEDADQDLRTHAKLLQPQRQGVGARVELAVGQTAALELHSDAIGHPFHLGLEECRQRSPGKIRARIVPLDQNPVPLLRGQKGQPADPPVRLGSQSREQRQKMSRQALDRRSFEDLAVVVENAAETIPLLKERDREIVSLRGPLGWRAATEAEIDGNET
jgi:hypothetical protein